MTDGTQHYNGLLLSVARRAGRGTTVSANYTLSNCYGSPDGNGGAASPNLATGYNDPNDPQFDDGNCTSDRRHVLTMTAGVESPRFERKRTESGGVGLAAGGQLQRAVGSVSAR